MLHAKTQKLLSRLGLSHTTAPPDPAGWEHFVTCVDDLLREVLARQKLLENTLATSTTEMERIYEHLKTTSSTELVQHARRFKMLFEASPLPYLIFDQGHFIDCNAAAVKILGAAEKSDIIGKHPSNFSPVHQPDGRTSQEKSIEMDSLALANGIHRFEWVHRTISGRDFLVDVTLSQVSLDGRNVLLVAWVDLTQAKENELQMLHSERLISLGEMAASIAHEINNPLTIISGYAYKITQATTAPHPDTAAIDAHAKAISSTCFRIAAIVKGLRNLSRNAEADNHEVVSIADIAADIVALTQDRLRGHSVRISCDIAEELQVRGTRTQLGQVLLNLIANADDAIRTQSDPWIRVAAQEVNGQIEISVTDSGPGLSEKVREKLFSSFFTTKERGKGTGLGLSLSRKILEKHRGALVLDATSPNTRFVLRLPVVRQHLDASA